MTESNKSNRWVLIGGVTFISIFIVLILMVNGWIKRSLQDIQEPSLQTQTSIAPHTIQKKDTKSSAAIMERSQLSKPGAVPLVKPITTEREKRIEREAPILDKFLNE